MTSRLLTLEAYGLVFFELSIVGGCLFSRPAQLQSCSFVSTVDVEYQAAVQYCEASGWVSKNRQCMSQGLLSDDVFIGTTDRYWSALVSAQVFVIPHRKP